MFPVILCSFGLLFSSCGGVYGFEVTYLGPCCPSQWDKDCDISLSDMLSLATLQFHPAGLMRQHWALLGVGVS